MVIDFKTATVKRYGKIHEYSPLNISIYGNPLEKIAGIRDFQVVLINFNYLDKSVVQLPHLTNINARGNLIEK